MFGRRWTRPIRCQAEVVEFCWCAEGRSVTHKSGVDIYLGTSCCLRNFRKRKMLMITDSACLMVSRRAVAPDSWIPNELIFIFFKYYVRFRLQEDCSLNCSRYWTALMKVRVLKKKKNTWEVGPHSVKCWVQFHLGVAINPHTDAQEVDKTLKAWRNTRRSCCCLSVGFEGFPRTKRNITLYLKMSVTLSPRKTQTVCHFQK